ncbi:CRE-MLT-10 protein, partial [Aphelenchoides avenae]
MIDAVEDPKKLRKYLTSKKREHSRDPTQRITSLLQDGMKLGYALAGRNVSVFENGTVKMISPRFFSVVPDKTEHDENFLSPSLLSLHSEGKGIEQLTSLPNMIKGFGTKDQQAWMNLIMEAAGVNEDAERVEQELKSASEVRKLTMARLEKEIRAPDGTPLYFTKENATQMFGTIEERKINTWEQLERSFNVEQFKEMNTTGFTTMTHEQLHLVYGPQSPYSSPETLEKLLKLNESELHSGIEQDIHALASTKNIQVQFQKKPGQVRQKRQLGHGVIGHPIVLTWIVPPIGPFLVSQPIILSPVLLSPIILSPAALGPVILSPWLFVP